ncbi:MAG: FAD-dependent thymidylate synthase [Syntrophobacterales bacterium]|jgi:flavin-dependent thymidylate synthase|nr:FAD-dependent thymidylate synthase [Syntrophobacterales bacterium]
MDVILAGYNLDYETICEIVKRHPAELHHLTPETISAAYARISRSPKSVPELRAIAKDEIEKSRQFNSRIFFEMGHSSIAEHAVFNIDIMGVSRLLAEEIEKFRLCSYMEKSQRYVLLSDDFVVPKEICDARLDDRFRNLVQSQNKLYHRLYGKLRRYVFETHADLAEDPANHFTLDGWAKEDARYVLSLATQTQMGITLNARNIELVLRRMASHPLHEANEYGWKLYAVVKPIAPSLIRYTDRTDYDHLTFQELSKTISHISPPPENDSLALPGHEDPSVRLVHAAPDADDRVLASFMYMTTNMSIEACRQMVVSAHPSQKKEIFKSAFRYMKSHDAAPRELESVDLTYELILSASCFAQLKRHRMATLLCQDYQPELGVTVPRSVCETGMEADFLAMIRQVEDMYDAVKALSPLGASYCLTNAHRRRMTIKVNARELYHIARLRLDRHAQWDIRNIAGEMISQARKVMPLTLMLATGKDDFAACYAGIWEHDNP